MRKNNNKKVKITIITPSKQYSADTRQPVWDKLVFHLKNEFVPALKSLFNKHLRFKEIFTSICLSCCMLFQGNYLQSICTTVSSTSKFPKTTHSRPHFRDWCLNLDTLDQIDALCWSTDFSILTLGQAASHHTNVIYFQTSYQTFHGLSSHSFKSISCNLRV